MNIPESTKRVTIEYQTDKLPSCAIGEIYDGRIRVAVVCEPVTENWKDSPEMKYAVRETFEKP